MWLFNKVGWAPLVDEKIVPLIEFLELLIDIPEILMDLINDYSNEKVNDLFLLLWTKEDKLPFNEESIKEKNLTLDIYKKIITKIKSKLNSLVKWIDKGKIQKVELEINKKFIKPLEELKVELTNKSKELLKEITNLKWEKAILKEIKKYLKENEDYSLDKLNDLLKWFKKIKKFKTIVDLNTKDKEIKKLLNEYKEYFWEDLLKSWLVEKEEILEKINNEIELVKEYTLDKIKVEKPEIYKELENLVEEDKKIKKENEEIIKNKIKELIIPTIEKIKVISQEIIDSLWIDKWLHIIDIDVKKAIAHCPILLNVDMTVYSKLRPYLRWFKNLKNLVNVNDFQWITGWMIKSKIITPEKEKDTQGRVFIELMVGSNIIDKVFINQKTYKKDKEFYDNLEIWDIVLIKAKKSIKFNLLATSVMIKLPELYDKVINKGWEWVTSKEKLFLK